MTLQEQYSDIIYNMSDNRLRIYVNFLNDMQGATDQDFDEVLDDLFCEYLLLRHKQNNPVFKKSDFMPLEDFAEEIGIDLGANYEV